MVIGRPNARRDFHIDPADEFFYQLEGNMVLQIIDAEGKRQKVPIAAGEVMLLPANASVARAPSALCPSVNATRMSPTASLFTASAAIPSSTRSVSVTRTSSPICPRS